MSVECSECERDARAGHAEDCGQQFCDCGHRLKDHAGRFVGCCAADMEDGELVPCDCDGFQPWSYGDE